MVVAKNIGNVINSSPALNNCLPNARHDATPKDSSAKCGVTLWTHVVGGAGVWQVKRTGGHAVATRWGVDVGSHIAKYDYEFDICAI